MMQRRSRGATGRGLGRTDGSADQGIDKKKGCGRILTCATGRPGSTANLNQRKRGECLREAERALDRKSEVWYSEGYLKGNRQRARLGVLRRASQVAKADAECGDAPEHRL